jgi:hypothetical protein
MFSLEGGGDLRVMSPPSRTLRRVFPLLLVCATTAGPDQSRQAGALRFNWKPSQRCPKGVCKKTKLRTIFIFQSNARPSPPFSGDYGGPSRNTIYNNGRRLAI